MENKIRKKRSVSNITIDSVKNSRYEEKKNRFQEQMREYARKDIAVAFSGGADSSLLLAAACAAACETGRKVYGIFVDTMLQPSKETEMAKRTAIETGAIFRVLEIDELKEVGIENNPEDRCYRCKRYLFQELRKEAEKLGAGYLLEGTNADDLGVYRPGIRAIQEMGLLSPLAELGFTKAEVRKLAGEYGLSTAAKPSAPCLATRFPYGARLSCENIRRVEQGEAYLSSLGFYNVRLRVHGRIARIEVDVESLMEAVEQRERIIGYLKCLGYQYVTLDLEGFRSGSMDVDLENRL